MFTTVRAYAVATAIGISLLAATTFGAWTWGNHIKLQAAKFIDLKDSTIASQADTIRHKGTVIAAYDWRLRRLQAQLTQAKASAAAEARLISKTQTMEDVRDRIIKDTRATAGLNAPVDPDLVLGLRAAWCGLYDPSQVSGHDLPAAGSRGGAGTGAAGDAAGGDCAQTAPAQTFVTKADLIQWWVADQVESILADQRRAELVQLNQEGTGE